MSKNIHIIGGGIIGLCSAWYLTEEGFEVTVIDRNDFSDGTSYGNAGMIVPSHFIPMTTPGVILQGLKWMLNSKSPFYIKPRLDVDLMKWLWHFFRAANPQRAERAMPALLAFNEWSKDLYAKFAATPDFDFDFEERGLLMLYKTEKQAEEEMELVEKAHHFGLKADVLDHAGLKKLEPEMDLDVLGGIYFPGDAHCYPNKFMPQIIAALKTKGVNFMGNTDIADFESTGGKITGLRSTTGEVLPVENVLVASGAWSGKILKKVGLRTYMQDGKGYSVTLPQPGLRPRIPTILTEAKVAVTPMGQDLRIGGTLELSGLSNKISQSRVQGVLDSIPAYYKNMEIPPQSELKTWKGFRPCTPDGLPYIGKTSAISNLMIASGHGMMGLSMGPATGKLVSEIATGQAPSIEMDLFNVDRF